MQTPRRILTNSFTATVTTASGQLVGSNARRVRIAISAPLSNPVNLELSGVATTTSGWPLVVGGFPFVRGDGETLGVVDRPINAIANGGNAEVYVIEEFFAPDDWP